MAKLRIASYHTFGDMNYFLLFLVQYRQSTEYRQSTDRQTESDAYEPTVQFAQVGSKKWMLLLSHIIYK